MKAIVSIENSAIAVIKEGQGYQKPSRAISEVLYSEKKIFVKTAEDELCQVKWKFYQNQNSEFFWAAVPEKNPNNEIYFLRPFIFRDFDFRTRKYDFVNCISIHRGKKNNDSPIIDLGKRTYTMSRAALDALSRVLPLF